MPRNLGGEKLHIYYIVHEQYVIILNRHIYYNLGILIYLNHNLLMDKFK